MDAITMLSLLNDLVLKSCIAFFLLTVSLCLAVVTGHTQSSFPGCLQKNAGDSTLSVQEYYYKGQIWYGVTPKNIKKVSDYMATTQLFDTACGIIGNWKKGGIAGLNKISPDTIDTKKLWLRQSHPFIIPDTIRIIATQQHASSIDAYTYKGEPLYSMPPKKILSPAEKNKKIIREYYYRADGSVVLIYKRAAEASFMRAQGWETPGADPAKLKKLFYHWQQYGDDYLYQQP